MKIRIAYDPIEMTIPPQKWWPDGTVTVYKGDQDKIIISMIDFWRIDLENDIILPERNNGEKERTKFL